MLFQRSFNGLLLCCVNDEHADQILALSHGSNRGGMHILGRFEAQSKSHKILRYGFYWAIYIYIYIYFLLFFCLLDSYKYVQSCKEFQQTSGKEKIHVVSLKPIILYFPFSKWGLDYRTNQSTVSFREHLYPHYN